MAFALRLAVIAFSITLLRGLLLGWNFEATVESALFAGGIYWGIGWFLGEVSRRVIEEHVHAKFAEVETQSVDNEHSKIAKP